VLYGYPAAAAADNWVHDCLCEIISSIHSSLDAGETPKPWPAVIPSAHRDRLATRTGLKGRLIAYQRAIQGVSRPKRDLVLQALIDENEIPLLLSGARSCATINDLPQPMRKCIATLFQFVFQMLTGLGVRDKHYSMIYEAATSHVCPFCGYEYFDAPAAPREALDHYLAESIYPFAAANLKNLVPMGNKCNSRYKLAQDILKWEDGSRRRSFYPYNHGNVGVCLDNSVPFCGTDGKIPAWHIEFDQDGEEVTTWDHVFHIRERYKRDVLDPHFSLWLREFGSWCKSAGIRYTSDQDIVGAIERYTEYWQSIGFRDRAFLRAAVFRMLSRQCNHGNQSQRLLSLLKDLVAGVTSPVV
jgi:hypothetical protein